MKRLLLLLPLTALTACSNLPKDSIIRNAEINTPWGSTKIELAATGAAAKNLSASERKEILTSIVSK